MNKDLDDISDNKLRRHRQGKSFQNLSQMKKPPVPAVSHVARGTVSLPELFNSKSRRSKSEWPSEKNKEKRTDLQKFN